MERAAERRATPRIETEIAATCRVPATPQPGTVLDLSQTGCRLAMHGGALPLGATVHVTLRPGLNASGMITWTAGGHAGVRFHRRLTTAQAIDLDILLGPSAPQIVAQVTPRASGGLQHWMRKVFGLAVGEGRRRTLLP